MPTPAPATSLAAQARAFQHAKQAAVCDELRPFEYGTVLTANRFPTYHEYNLVRVERDTSLGLDELISLSDEALAACAHRRVDFEVADAVEALRPALHARGWESERVVWMHHDGSTPPAPPVAVEQVGYDAAAELRFEWHSDQPEDPTVFLADAREVAMGRDPLVLLACEHGTPVGYAQLERLGSAAEIASVYVTPGHRGAGLGTAITAAAITAAADAEDLWIVADDEGRAKDLYARLGFRPVWAVTEVSRWPA